MHKSKGRQGDVGRVLTASAAVCTHPTDIVLPLLQLLDAAHLYDIIL